MNTNTKLNITSIIGVKDGIDQIFTLINQHLDEYAQNTNDSPQIESCRTYVHQLNGLLDMLELNDITIVSQQMEKLMGDLADRNIEPEPFVIETIQQTTRALLRYLNELIEGADENPLRLFPAYRDIMQAQGIKNVSESSLFVSRMVSEPSFQAALFNMAPSEIGALAKKTRTAYQTAFLKWLRDSSDKESLQQMADAISQIEKFPGSNQQRSFWWACTGFMDHLLQLEGDVELPTRKLCGKIEQEIRRLADGKPSSPGQLMRDVLYQVASSSADSERIREISHTYEWPNQLTASNDSSNTSQSIDEQATQQSTLDAMRKTLELTFDDWDKFSSGEHDSLEPLGGHTEELRQLVTQLNSPPFEKLITTISHTVTYLHAQPQNMSEALALELAAALLMVQASLEDFNQLSPEFPEQVDTLVTRLRLITTGERNTTDESSSVQTEHHTQEKALHAQAAIEILANLEKIERILDKFFVNPALRPDLQKLPPLFNQITGVLVMSELDRAKVLLSHCHNLVNKFTDPAHDVTPSEQSLIANGISSLGFFLEALKSAQPRNNYIIELAITQFDEADIPESTITTPPAEVTDMEAATDITPLEETPAENEEKTTATDPELLSIFLEEADEVLAEISGYLQVCRDDPTQVETTTSLMRSFHTLKGSGRMVNLHDLGEVAWRMEQALDNWANEQKPITEALVHLVTRAHETFRTWCDNLKQQGTTEIDAAELQRLIDELVVEQPNDAQAVQSESTPEEDTSADIIIGDLTIPRDLFDIFIAEAYQHLNTLENELNTLALQDDATANDNFVLAAHTLSSTAQTLGFTFIAELAAAVEQWLLFLQEDGIQPNKASLECAREIITLLDIMLQSINNRQLPGASDMQTGQVLAQELAQLLGQEEQPAESKNSKPQTSITTDQGLLSSPLLMPTSIPAEPEIEPYDEQTDVNPELWKVFFEEAQELTPEVEGKLRAWSILPQDLHIPKALLRALHTLKGSTRMAGAMHLGELIHNMESGVEDIANEAVVSVPMIEKLKAGFDDINDRIDRIQNPRPLEEHTEAPSDEALVDEAPSASEDVATPTAPSTEEALDTPTQAPLLRVKAELIDHLVNESGEMSIARSKVEAQLYNFKESLLDLNESVERLRGQLREVEIQAETQMKSQTQEGDPTFDPLEFDQFTRFQELTRLMAESVDDVVTVQQSLQTTHSAAEEAVTQQAQINRQLQQELIHLRTVPFGSTTEHFYRVIRQTATDLNKKVNLDIQGDDVEIDRSVLDRINSPLEHLLRNAVAHGIEEPEQRLQLDKPETGEVAIKLRQEGNEVIITLSDDGGGLDTSRIREEAISLGLIQDDETLDKDQLMALIFAQGLSTNKEVTGISGRGIGMDVVKNEVTTLGGRIEIQSEANTGTTFSIYLPLTLAVAQTVMVRAGKSTYALRAVTVEHIHELGTDALKAAYENHQITFNEKNYPLAYLPHLLGETQHVPDIKRHNRLLMLHSGTLRLAIHVDELLGNSEVVVKNIGPQLSQAPGVEGATIMGDGEIILIINPVKLMQREDAQEIFTSPPVSAATTQPETPTRPTIMVVDDSLTVRKVTSRLLEREGCEVLIAKEGLSAIKLLQDVIPDVMLVDLEMPQMNGFELIRNVRNNPKTANMPIIIISSRTAEKHRKMANELGVNVFLGKPYNEKDLLEHITQFIKP